jgi:hypothetical protein
VAPLARASAVTISAYTDAAIALDAWMTAEGIDADFTGCDTKLLNRFFAAYFAARGERLRRRASRCPHRRLE